MDAPALAVLPPLSEDHFLCPLCRKVFSDPVSMPCGHNFCKACLSRHWADDPDDPDDRDLRRCPTCSKRYQRTTEFCTNAVMAAMLARIKRRNAEAPEGVRSCRVAAPTRHQPAEPVEDLQGRTCRTHGRLRELYCRTEGVCVCLLCAQTDHKDHPTVPVEEEAARQRETLHFRKAHVTDMIGKTFDRIKKLAKSSRRAEERSREEAAAVGELFGSLQDKLLEKELSVTSTIEMKLCVFQEANRAEVQALRAEAGALRRTLAQLEALQRSADSFRLLQTLRELSESGATDRTGADVGADPYVQTVRKTVSQLLRSFQARLKKLTETELTRLAPYRASVTFDPSTAGPFLTVSQSGTRLRHVKSDASPPSPPSDRFQFPMVFATRGFARGRHYWHVKVGLRGSWDVGLAYRSVRRTKGVPVLRENGFFTLRKRKGEYRVACSPRRVLHLCPRPKLVGVYLDYEGGKVSFYDVERKLHLHSYTRETFTDTLFPCFYLHSTSVRSEALVIKPVAGGAA